MRLTEAWRATRPLTSTEDLHREELIRDCERLRANDPMLMELLLLSFDDRTSLSRLTGALRVNRRLKSLTIKQGGHCFSAAGCRELMEALIENNTLREFTLYNELEAEAVTSLAAGLARNRTLTSFTLVDSRITLDELRVLISALKENHYILSFNIISDAKPCPWLYAGSDEATEIGNLTRRNTRELIRVLMAAGEAYQDSERWREAVARFEQVIEKASIFPVDRDVQLICSEARKRRRVCQEMLERAAVVGGGAAAAAAAAGGGGAGGGSRLPVSLLAGTADEGATPAPGM